METPRPTANDVPFALLTPKLVPTAPPEPKPKKPKSIDVSIKAQEHIEVYPALVDFYITSSKKEKIPMQTPLHKNTCILHSLVLAAIYKRDYLTPPPLLLKRIRAKSVQYVHIIQAYNNAAIAHYKQYGIKTLPPKAPFDDYEYTPEPPIVIDLDNSHSTPMEHEPKVLFASPGTTGPISAQFRTNDAVKTHNPIDVAMAPAVHKTKCHYCSFASTYGLCHDCRRDVIVIQAYPLYSPSLKVDMGMLVRIYQRKGADSVKSTLQRAIARRSKPTPPPPKQPKRDFKLTSRDLDYNVIPATSLKQARALNRAVAHHERQLELLKPEHVGIPSPKSGSPNRSPRSSSLSPPIRIRPRVPDPALDPMSQSVTDAWIALNMLSQQHPELHTAPLVDTTQKSLTFMEEKLQDFAHKQGDTLSTRVTSFFSSIWNFLNETGAIVPIIMILIDIALIALVWWISTFEVETLTGFFFKISVLSILTGITAGLFVMTASVAFELITQVKTIVYTAPEFKQSREKIAKEENLPVEEVFPQHNDTEEYSERPPRPNPQPVSRKNNPISQLNSEAFNLVKFSLEPEREFKRIEHAYLLAQEGFKEQGGNPTLAQMYADVFYMTLRSVCVRLNYKDSQTKNFRALAVHVYQTLHEYWPEMFVPDNEAPPRIPPEFVEAHPFLVISAPKPPKPKGKEKERPPSAPVSSADFLYTQDLPDHPKKQNHKDKQIDPFHGVRATISDTLSKAVTEVGKSAVGIVDDVAALGMRDVTSTLHTVATTVRDAKSLFDIFTPLVTSVVAFVYEKATGKIYISSDEKVYHDKLIPMMERLNALEATPGFNSQIMGSPDFRQRVQSAVDEYEMLRTSFFKTAPDRLNTIFLSRLPTINEWKLKIFEGQCSGKERTCPVMIELVGLPASGKSTLTKLLFKSFHELERAMDGTLPEWNQGLLYDRKVANEYWDGHNENPYILMDDIFQALDVDIRFTQAMEIIQVVNTAPFQLHMSGVNDKKNHFAQPKLVITTRNGELTPARLNIADPYAYYRRRTFLIEVVPNLKYAGAQPWDPDYLQYWKLLLHDPFGNFLCEISPEMLARMAHAKWTENKLTSTYADPSLVAKTTHNPNEVKAALTLLTASTRQALQDLHSPTFESVDDEMHFPEEDEDAPSRKQGNFIKSDEDIKFINSLDTIELEYSALRPAEKRSFWERVNEKLHIPRLRLRLQETQTKFRVTKIEFDHWIEKTRTEIGARIIKKFTSIKEWTVKKFTEIKRIARAIPTLLHLLAIGSIAFLKEMVVGFVTDVANYVKENKWKVLFGLIGLTLAISGAVALATYFSRREAPPDFQSRAEDKREEKREKERERKQEEEEARRERQIEAALRGNTKQPAWKSFDDQVDYILSAKQDKPLPDLDIVSKQYASTDIPFLNVYFKNTYNINYWDETGGNHGRGQLLFITGRIAITAAHIVAELRKNAQGGQVSIKRDSHTFRFFIRDMHFDYIPATEAGVIKFPIQCPQHHSILNHFATEEELLNTEMHEISETNVLSRLDTGAHIIRELGIATLDYLNPYVHLHPEDPVLPYWTCPTGKTTDGDSGGMWYTSNTRLRFRILGIHSGGGKRTAFASPITQTMLKKYIELSPGLSTPTAEATGYAPPEIAPGFVPEATLKQGASLPPRNDIVPSCIAHELYHAGWKTSTLPSVVKPIVPFQHAEYWRERGIVFDGQFTGNERISPLEVIQTKLSFDPILFPRTTLPTMLPNYHMEWPRPQGHYNIYHPHEIIYGLPALSVEHIRMDASPGYPYTVTSGMKSRKQIFGANPTQCKPQFMEALERIRDENRTNGQYMPIYTLSIKVERRPVEKVFEANSRSIFGGPVDFQVFGQMFFYDLMQAAIAHCTSRITIGIDPHSKDWKTLFHRLRKHPNLIETDAKRWDNSQEIIVPEFFVEQFLAYLNSMQFRNRTRGFLTMDELLKHARKLTIGCLQAYVISMSHLYSTWYQIKSGNFITTLFNCFLNDLRWIVVYAVLAYEHGITTNDILKHHRANVESAFHGDDALLSVSDTVAPWFNALSARSHWKKIWNIELTPAGVNKNNEFAPFVAWEAARFLKRGFAPADDGHVYAPLEPSVIHDMVLWCTDAGQNAKITKHNIAAALMEAAHHPEPFFNKLEADLKRAANAKNIQWVASTYKQYRQMFRRVTPPTVDFTDHAREVALGEVTL
jgi:ABC-type multidrug transport system fused ATPase/permease subunit